SLICFVLQDEGEIPTDRAWIYEKGIKLLLSQWNNEKQIEGWEVGTEAYRSLSLDKKYTLLTEIAARKFNDSRNSILFHQEELTEKITQKLHLACKEEGLAVLKAIEAQHGLLIERADELWSFSHLTFQEHFTVQWLNKLSSDELAGKLEETQWQDVVNKLVKSQHPADKLLKLIKRAIDQPIKAESEIQDFLTWLLIKSKSTHSAYKQSSIRSLFYSPCALKNSCRHNFELALTLDNKLARDQILSLALDRSRDCSDASNLTHHDTVAVALDLAIALDLDLDRVIKLSRECGCDLTTHLIKLREALPSSNRQTHTWWKVHGPCWIEQLRQIMIEYRDIGYDWQFTDEQKQQLQRYYDANKFLVDLMKIEGAVTEDCRAEIEDGLLLPWAELQRRYPQTYGDLE
ncbi:MAG: hypothetical protein F6K30_21810, partial [Cyanothece sp. SIO2G6]|nr:hypothetical protein [Cyanothece sp. SIO2G6]